MKIFAFFILAGLIATGCASSEKNSSQKKEYPNLVTINPPSKEQKTEDSNIYVDSVEVISRNDTTALLISGSFPDGCTRLKHASHKLENDSLYITLHAWRDTDMMCTQILTSFSFVYDKIPEQILKDKSAVTVNNQSFPLL